MALFLKNLFSLSIIVLGVWYVLSSTLTLCLFLQEGYNLAVMHIGAPACGMNAAVRSFVRNCIYRGDTALGVHDGVEGLLAGNVCIIVLRLETQ
jgi:hypothetical protein